MKEPTLNPEKLDQMMRIALAQPQMQPVAAPVRRWTYGGLALAVAACLVAFAVLPAITQAPAGGDDFGAIAAEMSDLAAYDVLTQAL